MYEVIVEKRGRLRWEWRVCDRAGRTVAVGSEKTRHAARYHGERALFELLRVRVAGFRRPPQAE
jgi:hypothetical protein